MIFDSKGLPQDNGATDKMDSCRLSGLMAVIYHPQAPMMEHYVVKVDGVRMGVRHPDEFFSNNPLNFTRDQLIPLIAGLYAQNGITSVARHLFDAALSRGCRAQNSEYDAPGSTKQFPNGADLLHPGHMLILAKASGYSIWWTKLFGYPMVVIDVLFNAIFTPTREPNQLICALSVLGPKWLKFYKFVTPRWRTAVTDYWSGWRDEEAFGKAVISWLEKI